MEEGRDGGREVVRKIGMEGGYYSLRKCFIVSILSRNKSLGELRLYTMFIVHLFLPWTTFSHTYFQCCYNVISFYHNHSNYSRSQQQCISDKRICSEIKKFG